jgi:hypothetical protein
LIRRIIISIAVFRPCPELAIFAPGSTSEAADNLCQRFREAARAYGFLYILRHGRNLSQFCTGVIFVLNW